VCRSKHVEPSINFGIINSITSWILLVFLLSHTIQESMNIKYILVFGLSLMMAHRRLKHVGDDDDDDDNNNNNKNNNNNVQ